MDRMRVFNVKVKLKGKDGMVLDYEIRCARDWLERHALAWQLQDLEPFMEIDGLEAVFKEQCANNAATRAILDILTKPEGVNFGMGEVNSSLVNYLRILCQLWD